jgi:KaiC/GvpD/RAD55 family RecA-like ATPase
MDVTPIPPRLRLIPRWIVWDYMDYGDGKKPRKVPLHPDRDHGINYNDPSAWRTFEDVMSECCKRDGVGIGFVFSTADDIVGVDLDDAYSEDGRLKQWAREVVKAFQGCYCEQTPSGRGLHILGHGGQITGRSRVELEDGGIERYSENRWFTFTGESVSDGDLRDMTVGLHWLADTFFGGREDTKPPAPVAARSDADEAYDKALARVCLEHISSVRAHQGDDWRSVGYACKGTSEELLEDWIQWSSNWPGFDRGECLDRWSRFDSRSGVGTLVHMATKDSGLSSAVLRDRARRRVLEEDRQSPPAEAPTPTLLDAIQAWMDQDEEPCIKTGLPSLDNLFGGGLPIGQMTAVAAAPGVGKSSLAMHLAIQCLLNDEEMVATWCLGEMTKASLAARAITNYGGRINHLTLQDVIHKVDPSAQVAQDLGSKVGNRLKIVEAPLVVDKIEQAVVKDNSRLLIVDYLQLCRAPRAFQDKTTEINECLLRLRELTTSRNIATLLVTNIAKGCDANTEIGNIGKGSNQIDFDVDNFLFGHRTGEYSQDGEVKIEWRCKKLRQGQMADVELWFDGKYQVFMDSAPVPFADFERGAF